MGYIKIETNKLYQKSEINTLTSLKSLHLQRAKSFKKIDDRTKTWNQDCNEK